MYNVKKKKKVVKEIDTPVLPWGIRIDTCRNCKSLYKKPYPLVWIHRLKYCQW